MERTPLGDWITRALDAQPENAVWARAEREVTWGRMKAEVDRLTGLLQVQGVRPGDLVAVQMSPTFTYLWTVLALWSFGARVMVLDPRLTGYEVERLVALCEPRHLISSGRPGAVRVVFRDEGEIQLKVGPGGRASGTEHALLQFSSGSTGHPKIIGRTGKSLLAELGRFAGLPDMPRAGERVLLGNSLTHSFGLIGGVLHALGAGATLVFVCDARPRALLNALEATGADVLFAVPFHFELLNRIPEPVPLPHLRMAVSGGEMLRPEIFAEFHRRYGVSVGQAYGMTEVGIVATDLTGRNPPPSVGDVVPGLETRIKEGELQIRTDASPYLYASDLSTYAEGWLRTHDHCAVDPVTGTLLIRGRTDSLVVIGGLKVDLTELELALVEHPDVTEAVVLFSDTIEAFVEISRRTTAKELQDWCRTRLSAHKIPRRFQICSAIPRTTNGKLIRNRDRLMSRTGAAS